ncbi:PA2169 family four-helix-bundle protein [Hyunsoonleella sp. SJ7]|uniref:PA2169 family four-helix-bundle protein n=1 Tax=Hyunsoonleella aquatilis TaxID=2762758 RepID=A0A923KK71_9FLAO|nr:PA2169 family four-helix-bundle protein [Hyunsoonleella aquatilis]MBC3758182.1 PA2169 family four-helix-bundle protein [Hyunsoonleella aquatilis]
MKYTEKISKNLNELLIKNYDAEKGYRSAAENVDSHTLKQFFDRMASERAEFASEIKTEIRRFGEEPKDSGSFKGLVHRNWMDLKTLFSSNDEVAIIEEVIRGEEKSLDAYYDILKERNLPASIDALLFKQKSAIQATINSVKVHEELVS